MNTCNNVHQKWPIYQEFLTHLARFFFVCVCIQMFCPGPKWLSYQNLHLSSGPFKWSALYFSRYLTSTGFRTSTGFHVDIWRTRLAAEANVGTVSKYRRTHKSTLDPHANMGAVLQTTFHVIGVFSGGKNLSISCGVYPLYVENADYAIMLIYYVMLCRVRLSSSPRCSSCLNCNPLTSCIDSSSSRYKLAMLFFRLFFIISLYTTQQ